MFERIIIHPQATHDASFPLDLGVVAESMLFYGSVEVALRPESLKQLLAACGAETLIEFTENGFLHFVFRDNSTGVRAETLLGVDRFAPTSFTIHSAEGARVGLERFAPQMFVDSVGRAGRGKRLFRRFERSLRIETMSVR